MDEDCLSGRETYRITIGAGETLLFPPMMFHDVVTDAKQDALSLAFRASGREVNGPADLARVQGMMCSYSCFGYNGRHLQMFT